MQIRKCDICRKIIKDEHKQYYISTMPKYNSYEICEACGKPLQKFLEDNKLSK
jgi:hypothetical protein